MRTAVVFILFLCFVFQVNASDKDPTVPLKDGIYQFAHKFAEQPEIKSIHFVVTIKGQHIKVENKEKGDIFPLGLMEEGQLKWHKLTKQWIISTSASDINAKEVGGCSDGPTVVDLVNKIYWTC